MGSEASGRLWTSPASESTLRSRLTVRGGGWGQAPARKPGGARSRREYVSAFANADSGVLILGVEEHGPGSGHLYLATAMRVILSAAEPMLRDNSLIESKRRTG